MLLTLTMAADSVLADRSKNVLASDIYISCCSPTHIQRGLHKQTIISPLLLQWVNVAKSFPSLAFHLSSPWKQWKLTQRQEICTCLPSPYLSNAPCSYETNEANVLKVSFSRRVNNQPSSSQTSVSPHYWVWLLFFWHATEFKQVATRSQHTISR